MTRWSHICIDSSMSTISTTTLFRSLIHLNMFYNKWGNIQSFCLQISPMSHFLSTSALDSAFFNNPKRNFADFSGQRATTSEFPSLGGPTKIRAEFFPLSSSADTSIESSKGNGLFMFTDIVEVTNCLFKTHAIDCLGCFTSVLEVNTEIWTACFCGFCWVHRGCCVADHGGRTTGADGGDIPKWPLWLRY